MSSLSLRAPHEFVPGTITTQACVICGRVEKHAFHARGLNLLAETKLRALHRAFDRVELTVLRPNGNEQGVNYQLHVAGRKPGSRPPFRDEEGSWLRKGGGAVMAIDLAWEWLVDPMYENWVWNDHRKPGQLAES